jgi:hypothetical protein
MKMRGLNDPLLVTSDGAPGIIKAIEVCLPRAARQRCLAHRMRNLAAKVSEDPTPQCQLVSGLAGYLARPIDHSKKCSRISPLNREHRQRDCGCSSSQSQRSEAFLFPTRRGRCRYCSN